MKPNRSLRRFLAVAASSLLAISCADAQSTLYWDANAATALQIDGLGAWLTANQWWNGSTNTTWASGDSAVFGYSGAGGAVTLSGTTTIGSLVFNPFTGTYTLGTTGAGNAITLNSGITHNSGGTATILSPLILGGAQTWTNNSGLNITGTAASGSLSVTGGVDNGGNLLTIDSIGTTNFGGTASVISGAGGLTKNGSGVLILSAGGTTPVHTYSGTTTINGGIVRFQNVANATGTGNLTITSGVLEGYFGNAGAYVRNLGAGAGEIQILGGTSGFSGQGATSSLFRIGASGSTLVWGSGFFSPSVFVMQASTVNANGAMTLDNAIDLGGATRTIGSFGGDTTGGATVNGAVTSGGLTKIGVGNLILVNAGNNYAGATTINGGTITLSGNGAITATSALNLGGGTLRLVNSANTQRFADVAISATAGGGITYQNTSGAINYTETFGAATVSGGLMNVVQNTNQAGAGSQTLTLGTSGSANLTQSGTGSVAFSALTTGPQATGNKNMFVVFGAGTTTAGQIVGPWATVGTAANAQTDYAAYNADYVVPAAIAGSAETTWTVDADPYTMDFSSAGTTLTATRNVGVLRITGGAPLTSVDITTETITLTGHTFVDGNTVVFGSGAPGGLTAGTTYFVVSAAVDTFKVSATLAGAAINLTSAGTSPTVVPSTAPTLALSTGNNLGTNGILNGSPYAISITPGTGGNVTLPTTSAGELHVTTGGGAITINAPITDNTGALTLVKNGSAGTLILNGANTFTGNLAINAGTLQIGTNPTANGAKLNGGSYAGNIFIGAGANLDFQTNADQTLSGVISGDGNLLKRYVGTLTLSGNNTYTGKTTIGAITNSGSPILVVSSFNSVSSPVASSSLGRPTTVANGTIEMGSNNSTPNPTLRYAGAAATGETTDRIINFTFNSSATRTLDASNGSGLLKFTSPFTTSSGSTTAQLALTGTGAGEIAGLPFLFNNLTKSGAGVWTLAGPSGSVGSVSVSAGTLVATDPRALGAAIGNLATTGPTISGTGTLSLRNNSSVTFGVAGTGYNINNSASGATINVDRVSGTGAATMTVGNLTTTSTAATWGLNFTGANDVSLSAGTLDTPASTIAAVHTITNNIAGVGSLTLASVFNRAATIASPNLVFAGTGTTIVTGAITQTQTDMDLIKNDAGTLLLNGINTYTGTTSVNAGTLGGSGTIAGDVTVAAAGSIAPGASAGILSISGGLDISLQVNGGAGKLKFELGANTAASDQLAVTGALTTGGLLGFSDFTFSSLAGGPQNGSYVLITTGADPTGTLDGSNLSGPIGGGTGTLAVSGNNIVLNVTGIGGASAYDTWKAANAPGSNPDDDTDGDGVSNAVEFVLGGTSATNDIGKLPTVSTSGGNLVFSFKRKQSSIDPGKTTVTIEVGTDLVTWTNPPSPYAVSDVPVAGPPVAVVDNLDGTDTVTLTVLQDLARKFARLRVVITP